MMNSTARSVLLSPGYRETAGTGERLNCCRADSLLRGGVSQKPVRLYPSELPDVLGFPEKAGVMEYPQGEGGVIRQERGLDLAMVEQTVEELSL